MVPIKDDRKGTAEAVLLSNKNIKIKWNTKTNNEIYFYNYDFVFNIIIICYI
jgi:hypothetical protein